MITPSEVIELTASPQAEIARLRRALELAAVRLAILVGRMRACDEERPASHSVSLREGPAWIQEADAALAGRAILWREGYASALLEERKEGAG